MTDQRIQERYGAAPANRRTWVIALVAVVSAIGLSWLGWAASHYASPAIESELISFEVIDDHTITAKVRVTMNDAQNPTCLLRAMSVDHATVGEVNFAPLDGTQSIVIQTERKATSVEKAGCLADGQGRRR